MNDPPGQPGSPAGTPAPRLTVAPYGPPADDALAAAIVAAKAGDPLAPVTVAVPSTLCGLSLRRRFASRSLGAPGPGLANVRFLVLARVAELLGAPRLAAQGRQPFNHAVRLHAVRVALRADPGRLAAVAEHPDTLAAVDATLRDLRQASETTRADLASMGRAPAHAVRLYQALRAGNAASWYDDDDLAEAAAAAVADGDAALADVGSVIVHLPRRLSPSLQLLLHALAERDRLRIVAGTTGDATGDEALVAALAEFTPMLGPPAGPPPVRATDGDAAHRPHATRAVRAADPDDEVRTAVRGIVERLERGVELHRMAVVWRAPDPYALLVQDQLAAAAIPFSGPGSRRLAQTLAGRTLLGGLALRNTDFSRDAVLTWLVSAPVRLRAGSRVLVPATRFETLAAQASVVKGVAQWEANLALHAARLKVRRDELAADPDDERTISRLRRIERDVEVVGELRTFIADLDRRLRPPPTTSWREYSRWAHSLLDRYLGVPGADWPAAEVEAFETIRARLDGLAALDRVGPTDDASFLHAVEQALDAPAQRAGRFGDGVFVGRVADLTGMDFATVFVLGLADGTFPPPMNDDPLLPDRLRERAGPGMPKRGERRSDERRDWLAALAAAPERVIFTPHSDPRAQRIRLPARWYLEEIGHLAGGFAIGAGDLDHFDRSTTPWFVDIASFESGLHEASTAASISEYDLNVLLHAHRAGSVTQHPIVATDAHLRAGFDAQHARWTAAVTRWSGLAGADVRGARTTWSASRIQTLARCPFQFYLASILDIAEPARPEATDTINAADRGHLIHRCLERFLAERLADPPAPDQTWSAADHQRLRAIAAEEFAAAEHEGLTGRPLLWRLEQHQILHDLAATLHEDDRRRREQRLVPVGVEVDFGGPDSPVAVILSDGSTMAFNGRIDRIDRVDRVVDGADELVVVDYKTGKDANYRNLHVDPVNRGTQLQLVLYGLGARARYGVSRVRAAFWFISSNARFATRGYEVDDERVGRLRAVLDVLAGLVGAGRFPARPGNPGYENEFEHCRWCSFQQVCPPDRGKQWTRLSRDPALGAYVELAQGDGP